MRWREGEKEREREREREESGERKKIWKVSVESCPLQTNIRVGLPPGKWINTLGNGVGELGGGREHEHHVPLDQLWVHS